MSLKLTSQNGEGGSGTCCAPLGLEEPLIQPPKFRNLHLCLRAESKVRVLRFAPAEAVAAFALVGLYKKTQYEVGQAQALRMARKRFRRSDSRLKTLNMLRLQRKQEELSKLVRDIQFLGLNHDSPELQNQIKSAHGRVLPQGRIVGVIINPHNE